MNSAPPVLNVPELDALLAPLYAPEPFERLDNGQLVTLIQLMPGMALFRAAIALGAWPPSIKHHNIPQFYVSLQVMPIQPWDINATMMALDQIVPM